MSNALAIAAVTTTLRDLISRGLGSELGTGSVTVQPLDTARENGNLGNQLNLFLYHTQPNAAWRNRDIPNRVRSGETAYPPLALNLYYLLTAYGQNNDDILSHRLLGLAMQVLHDNTILNPEDIRLALTDSDLHSQVERVRLTPITLNLEEMSKLWATFQTQYRISAAYEASVVLIDSRRPIKTPLPVLRRGSRLSDGEETGIVIQPSTAPPIPPFPTLEQLELPNVRQPSIRLDETLVLRGYRLQDAPADQITLQFRHPRLVDPIEQVPTEAISDTQLAVRLDPNDPSWLAGTYTVAARFTQTTPPQTTNALPFSLAPRLIIPATAVTTLPDGSRRLTVTCTPQVWLWRHPDQPQLMRGQQVSLLVGDRELRPIVDTLPEVNTDPLETMPQPAQKPAQLVFDISDLPADTYWLRLRVDGVDSLVVNWPAEPPEFDPSQRITLA